MMPRIVSGAVLCVAVALVAACASSPPSRFYTLSPTASAAHRGAATSKLSVVVGPWRFLPSSTCRKSSSAPARTR
jgi:uncharacterized lipoprotein YmbA